jgi:ABC-type lipoprotein export system ATPase subunit
MSAYPTPSWSEFYDYFSRNWKQGEHVFISAQTGAGKTELLTKILPIRAYKVIFVTKPRDPIFKAPEVRTYQRQRVYYLILALAIAPTTLERNSKGYLLRLLIGFTMIVIGLSV